MTSKCKNSTQLIKKGKINLKSSWLYIKLNVLQPDEDFFGRSEQIVSIFSVCTCGCSSLNNLIPETQIYRDIHVKEMKV